MKVEVGLLLCVPEDILLAGYLGEKVGLLSSNFLKLKYVYKYINVIKINII